MLFCSIRTYRHTYIPLLFLFFAMFRFVDVYPWLACAGLGFDSDFYSIAYYRPRLINRSLTVVRDTHVIHIRVLYHFTRILRLLDLQLFESIVGMSESRFIVVQATYLPVFVGPGYSDNLW